MLSSRRVRPRRTPSPIIRITHWIGALSMLAMIGSGWLGGGIAWHFAAM